MLELSNDDLNDPGCILAFNKIMQNAYDDFDQKSRKLAQELCVDELYGTAIWYLRTRSRWTQELEDRLISMYFAGEELPNIFEWP